MHEHVHHTEKGGHEDGKPYSASDSIDCFLYDFNPAFLGQDHEKAHEWLQK